MYNSAPIHDSSEIPTATPMFPRSGNTERLLGLLSSVWVCCKSKMAVKNVDIVIGRAVGAPCMSIPRKTPGGGATYEYT